MTTQQANLSLPASAPIVSDSDAARIEGWRRRTSALAWACGVGIHEAAERNER